MGPSTRVTFILSGVAIICLFVGVLLGLTFGLATPPLEDGGSPQGPPGVGDPSTTESPANRPPLSDFGQYRFAAVASDAKICSEIGTDVLGRLGGSAVDAAIASMLCVGVVCAHSTGIGGGHFMTIYDTPRGGTEKELTTILARETAPSSAHRDMFVNNTDASSKGGMAIAVPGEVAGFYLAWQRFGRVPWADLITPTEQLLRMGFPVERSLASAIRQYGSDILEDENLREVFVNEDGTLKQEGDIFQDEKLADTFHRIALDPTDYYNGTLAEDIVADIADYGGNITVEDLQDYIAKEKDALNVTISNGGYTLYTPRPPSSGAIYQYMLNILDEYDLSGADKLDDDGVGLMYHRIAECFKFAYAKRSRLGDEDYVDVEELLKNLTSEDYASYIRSRIHDNTTHDVDYYEPDFEIEEDSGTSHLSVLAPGGAAVALTGTINLYFGSNVRGSRTGIIFNDEMDDFSTPGTSNSFGVPASPSNFIEPGKMPMSSMSPSIIMNAQGQPVLMIGAAGGTSITTAVGFVSVHNLWMGHRIDVALDTARIHHQLVPNWVRHESFIEQDILDGLVSRNHALDRSSSIAVVNAIHNACAECEEDCEQLCVHAASDGRKGGGPDGF